MSSLAKAFTERVLQSRNNAMLIAFLCSLLPLLGWLGLTVLALVSLRKGAREGALIMLAVFAPTLAFGLFNHVNNHLFWINQISVISLTWFLSLLLGQYSSWSMVLQWSSILGILSVVVAHYANSHLNADWAGFFAHYLSQTQQYSNLTSNEKMVMADFFSIIAQGIYTVFIIGSVLCIVLLGRQLQATVYNPGGLWRELLAIRVSKTFATIMLVIMLLSLSKQALGYDLLPVAIMPLLVAGLSLIHAFFQQKRFVWLWIGLLYFGLIILSPYSLGLVVFLAYIDCWYNFRQLQLPNPI